MHRPAAQSWELKTSRWYILPSQIDKDSLQEEFLKPLRLQRKNNSQSNHMKLNFKFVVEFFKEIPRTLGIGNKSFSVYQCS